MRVCLAGATGWAGSELARGIAKTADLDLDAAVARKEAGRILGEVLGEPRLTGRIYASAEEALATPCDVFVEYVISAEIIFGAPDQKLFAAEQHRGIEPGETLMVRDLGEELPRGP